MAFGVRYITYNVRRVCNWIRVEIGPIAIIPVGYYIC